MIILLIIIVIAACDDSTTFRVGIIIIWEAETV